MLGHQLPVPNRAARRVLRRPVPDPITVTVGGACEITGLSKSKLYLLLAEGALRSVTIGRRRLIFVDSIRALLDQGTK